MAQRRNHWPIYGSDRLHSPASSVKSVCVAQKTKVDKTMKSKPMQRMREQVATISGRLVQHAIKAMVVFLNIHQAQ